MPENCHKNNPKKNPEKNIGPKKSQFARKEMSESSSGRMKNHERNASV
jgi:hypothetical protein